MTETELLRLFDRVTRHPCLFSRIDLTRQNRRGMIGNELITLEHEFRIDGVAGRLVDFFPTEGAVEFVFVVVVETEAHSFAIGRELLFFVQHYELRGAPRLAGAADKTPEFKVGFEVAPADVVITRRLGGNAGCA